MDPNVSGVSQESIVGLLLSIHYTREMFELVERDYICLIAYADDFTLLAVVRKPAERPAVAASLNMYLARIQECCNLWWMILNLYKTKALVVSIDPSLSTLSMVAWSCLGFPFAQVPISTFLA